MGNERGLTNRLRALGRRRRERAYEPAVLELAVIHSELRRARRYRVPLVVATFTLETDAFERPIQEIARSLQAELREFDYIAVDTECGRISLWMFGTPREGLQTKLVRMQATQETATWIASCRIGVAVFPQDGMTYDALMDHALGQAPTFDPRLDAAMDGRVAWQPSVHGANSRSTS